MVTLAQAQQELLQALGPPVGQAFIVVVCCDLAGFVHVVVPWDAMLD